MPNRPRSYFWASNALDSPDYDQLSDDGYEGLEYAEQLAEDARYRVRELRSGRRGLTPLSITELARLHGGRPERIERLVEQARTELFGTRTDSGIRHLLKRHHHLQQRQPAACAAPGCTNPLPDRRTRRKRYCSDTCRVRAHRHRRRDRSNPSPPNAAPRAPLPGSRADDVDDPDELIAYLDEVDRELPELSLRPPPSPV